MRSFLGRIFKPSKVQEELGRNRAALHCLRELQFQPGRIRRALIELNGIRIRRLVNGNSPSLVYSTIKGSRRHSTVMDQLSAELDVPKEELFPEKEKSTQAAT